MSRHVRIDHARAAAKLRKKPGTWQPIGEYRNRTSANSTATMIRTASSRSGSHYLPAGSCESRLIFTEDSTLVEARYMPSAAGGGHVHGSADAERVLGQIDRGEVRAGRHAAREIAARAEAAYGGAWRTVTVRPISPAPAATTTGADAA